MRYGWAAERIVRCPACRLPVSPSLECGGPDEGWCNATSYSHDALAGKEVAWEGLGPKPSRDEMVYIVKVWSAIQGGL